MASRGDGAPGGREASAGTVALYGGDEGDGALARGRGAAWTEAWR